jgi:hypothetical protein
LQQLVVHRQAVRRRAAVVPRISRGPRAALDPVQPALIDPLDDEAARASTGKSRLRQDRCGENQQRYQGSRTKEM